LSLDIVVKLMLAESEGLLLLNRAAGREEALKGAVVEGEVGGCTVHAGKYSPRPPEATFNYIEPCQLAMASMGMMIDDGSSRDAGCISLQSQIMNERKLTK